MALADDAVLKVGIGHFYTAPVGTPRPTDLANIGPEWEHMGHTSLEDILSSNVEGGERTQLGSLQRRALKTSVSGRTESFTINLLQFDTDSLQLALGSNARINDDGDIEVPETPVATERAWLFLFFDGETVGGIYASRASFIAAESISISDTESLTQLPLEVTPMSDGDSTSPYRFIPPRVVEGIDDGSGEDGEGS
ncbi:hypothetical protein Q7C18_02760 [Nesterenkonia sp. CL21]|uniref:phage tail tube protein n=1 Tax=Nesterenkonia sp. CL21 TaxID=3064894 RepID=UPI002878278F|nr:hypothetical protein [Nesterenkonia sp. CL21]MDS2171610.1 hypothetical protein [Nesterenkonia sp. CL21]